MEKTNFNLGDHSSLIIADGSIVEINGQKVLLTLVKDGNAPETSEEGGELMGNSELVNKWVRCVDGYNHIFTTDKWYQCVKPIHQEQAFSTNHEGEHDGFQGNNHNRFDLYNPLDYNPETLIGKYWNGAKITGIYINENDRSPYFSLESTVVNSIKCSKVTPSDVTDTPPLPSLKYEDCFERLTKTQKKAIDYALWGLDPLACFNPRQAKQLAATIKLMTIMHNANGKDFVKKRNQILWFPVYIDEHKEFGFWEYSSVTLNQIGFKDKKTAERAYEANKEIFHDYFGINE